jgi:LemA protein
MKTSNIILITLGGLLVIIGLWTCSGYNGLVSSDQGLQNVWGYVATNYKRRTYVYRSIIKTIEGSGKFEKSTLKEVLEARSKATQVQVNINDAASLEAYQKAQTGLQSSFGRLMAVAESYPDLKTTAAFRDFQTQIEGTENRINVARQDYNKAIENYNLRVKRFPGNILAGFFGYKDKPYFKAAEGSEKAPQVEFNIP